MTRRRGLRTRLLGANLLAIFAALGSVVVAVSFVGPGYFAEAMGHSPDDPAGLPLLALYNIAFIAPLVILLAAVSDRRVLGRLGRWNRANSPWVKVGLALPVIAMSFGLLFTL